MSAVETFPQAAECQTLSVSEAAQILGVTEGFLHQRARDHGNIVEGLPFLNIGGRRRVPREKLLAYAAGDWTPGGES